MSTEVFSFPVQLRLRKPAEYNKVFSDPIRSTDQYFTILAIRNNLDQPRLGLAIAKKNIKRAVDRNRIKRSARESFRLQQYHLENLDIVVLAKREAANISSQQLIKSLERHWLRLINRCESYSSHS